MIWRPLILLLLISLPSSASAQQPQLPTPEKYTAQVRHAIHAARDQYVALYDRMIAGLQKLGFEFDPPLDELPVTHREDPSRNIIRGRVPGAKAAHLLGVPGVAQVLLVPSEFKLPDMPETPVLVQLELAARLGPAKQLELVDQTRAILDRLGFRESVGYDSRGLTGQPHTRLRGTISAGGLDTLIKDLRAQPTGWFAPRVPQEGLPVPLATVNPILLTTVVADPAPPKPLPSPPVPEDVNLEKFSPELLPLTQLDEPLTRPLRLEIILAVPPGKNEEEWSSPLLQAAPSLIIEGRLGQVVSAVFGLPFVNPEQTALTCLPVLVKNQLRALAALPIVSHLRFPTAPRGPADPALQLPGDPQRALLQTGLLTLHRRKAKGQGVRIGIADLDFRGLEKMIAEGKLGKKTRLVDLTAERNANLHPDPALAGEALGHGTQCAVAAQLAAPEAQLTLIRFDPFAPYMLPLIQQYARGELRLSPTLTRRSDEISVATAVLRQRRAEILAERRFVLDSFEDESDARIRYEILGPVRLWVFTPREWHQARVAELERDDRQLQLLEKRLLFQIQDVQSLQGLDVICVPLSWPIGHPLGGRSALARYFPPEPQKARPRAKVVAQVRDTAFPPAAVIRSESKAPLWVFPAGNFRNQVWHDYLRDEDGDGVLEFTDPDGKLQPDRWARDINFLAWQGYDGKQSAEIPGQISGRLTLQWTEPHAADYYFRENDDRYVRPLAELRVVVLRQRDPTGKTFAVDDFEVVAASSGRPERLDNYPDSATYEIGVPWLADKPGRYAIRIEKQVPARWVLMPAPGGNYAFRLLAGLAPTGIRPLGVPTLPAVERRWELRPIVFIEAFNSPPGQPPGRVVLGDFRTEGGAVGVPADSRNVISVAAADWNGKLQPYSSPGPPPYQQLAHWPRLHVYDGLGLLPAYGSNVASAFTAGAVAAHLSSGATRAQVWQQFVPPTPQVLKLAE